MVLVTDKLGESISMIEGGVGLSNVASTNQASLAMLTDKAACDDNPQAAPIRKYSSIKKPMGVEELETHHH